MIDAINDRHMAMRMGTPMNVADQTRLAAIRMPTRRCGSETWPVPCLKPRLFQLEKQMLMSKRAYTVTQSVRHDKRMTEIDMGSAYFSDSKKAQHETGRPAGESMKGCDEEGLGNCYQIVDRYTTSLPQEQIAYFRTVKRTAVRGSPFSSSSTIWG